MSQSRVESFAESAVSTSIGFVLSLAVWQFIVAPLYGYAISMSTNFGITAIFTVSSLARQYAVRRWFNGNVYNFVKERLQNAIAR